MKYSVLLNELKQNAEEDFACFQRKLIFTQQTILGVRTPTMRRLARQFQKHWQEVLAFPDEYFEVTFIKLAQVSSLSYNDFTLCVESCVEKIDNWATCDGFKANCIKGRQTDFLPILKRIFDKKTEFSQRYALVSLLYYYTDAEWTETLQEFINLANTQKYYVHMAVAWLLAEIITKRYEDGLLLLQTSNIDVKTYNKAIQKAKESYRLTTTQKGFLNSLKK